MLISFPWYSIRALHQCMGLPTLIKARIYRPAWIVVNKYTQPNKEIQGFAVIVICVDMFLLDHKNINHKRAFKIEF